MDSFDDIWNAVLDYFKARISSTAYDLCIKTIKFEGFENSTVTLRLPKQMHMSIVPSQYGELFYEAFDNILGFKVVITYVTDDIFESKKDNKISYQDRNLEDYRNEQFTFENFIVGPSNRFAYAAAKAVASDPGSKLSNGAGFSNYNPLFIYGNSGLGKTHLLNAICHEIERNFPEMTIMYVRAEQFANEFYQALQNKTIDDFHSKYRDNIDVLLIDDIQFIIGKESTQEEFFHTFNALHGAKKQIVISSDKPPKDMEILEDRLRSRFEWGLIVDISSPDYETRMAILRKKEELDGYKIDNEVIEYIARNVKSNIRELEGSLNKIMAYANLEKSEINLALAEKVLKDIISPNEKRVITPELITDIVAEHFDLTPEDIIGNKRNSKVVFPRQIVMYLCRHMTEATLKIIGQYLGGRDHTTIMNGINKIEAELKTSESTREVIDILKKKINPSKQ